MKRYLPVPHPYNFAANLTEHGWHRLAPNRWLANGSLQRIERLSSGRTVRLTLSAAGADARVCVRTETGDGQPASADEQREITQRVRWMLRLDDDLTTFHALCLADDALRAAGEEGRGRLLRSPTLWEDVVKMIATTNVTWQNTVAMIERLVASLGTPFPGDAADERTQRAFPTPQQVAAADPALFDERIRLGYRNAYVLRLAHEISSGTRDLEALRRADLPAPALKKELLSIKGVGPYAANALLMLLGCYGALPIDSEFRRRVRERHFAAREKAPTDGEMAAVYKRWGAWRALAYWLEG